MSQSLITSISSELSVIEDTVAGGQISILKNTYRSK